MTNSAIVEQLRWKKFTALSDGYVTLVDVMGDDFSVLQAARVSYGADNQPKSIDEERKTLRYMMRLRHTTPFEMIELKFKIRCPMDCWRQWIRQRMASVNEYSTRYSEAIASMDVTSENAWRKQSGSNRQGSGGNLQADDPGYIDGKMLSMREKQLQDLAKDVYQERLRADIAREQARKDLPLSNYTEAYWKIDLHNLFNFLERRMDSHAQKEIRDYANIIGNEIVAKLFPLCWEAFKDYRLNAVTLSGPEIRCLQNDNYEGLAGRELNEFIDKQKRLGLYPL